MASNWKASGGAGRLYIEATQGTQDPANNRTLVHWKLRLVEYSTSNTTWWGSPIDAYVQVGGGSHEWDGTFNLDWRGAGKTDQTIAQGSTWVGHFPDGTMSIGVAGWIDDTNTVGAGGPTTVVVTLPLTRIVVIPSVPTNVEATIISDTQVKVEWEQSSPANGQPTSNTIQKRVNGGSWEDVVTISPTTSTTVAAEPNQKLEYRVRANNSKGSSAFSSSSTPIYTTPAPPTGVSAVKESSLDIVIVWSPQAAYSEHLHEIWHGTVSGGVTTWDGSALDTVSSALNEYTHSSPDPSKVHIYRVRAVAGSLKSAWAESNAVQLLAPPNKPSIPALPAYADKAADLVIPWTHNPVDTTPQSAYEMQYSTNGGSSWSSTGKVASTTSQRTFAGGTYAAGVTLTVRVRTWGQATSGGSDGTGASPWSDSHSITFKTKPVATIISPADSGTVTQATLSVQLGFSQPEGATFVKAQVQLEHESVILETKETSNLAGTVMSTPVENDETYTVRARVQDSNGIWSSWDENTFSVSYLSPVAAGVHLTYLPGSGFGQIDLTIAVPGGGESAAETVTILRQIDGGASEVIVEDFPAASVLSFIDTTPTIHGTNTYTIITTSALGAQTEVQEDLVTDECRRAFLSKGPGFSVVGVFGANLSVSEGLSVAGAAFEAAGRVQPIGQYGVETDVQLKVSSFIFEREGFSTFPELRALLLMPGKSCYRDASGRRVFGMVKGSVKYNKADRGDLSFTLTETS